MKNENTNENKKKQKVVILIGLVTLLIAVLGATYAYFQISTNNESSNTNITGSTPPKSLVTLKQGTDNLHLNISASDMSYENRTKEYYGTDVEEKAYEDNESDGTKTIASVELTGGEETTKYSCTAKLTVSKVTEPLEAADTMIDVLHSGDMILQFKGNIISEQLDLSDLKETGSKEYNLNFKITGNKVENIQAYIKLLNKNENQNYLSGKKLNIDISTRELKCNVYIPDPKIIQLRAKDTQGYLSEELQGGMYRYQASFPDSDSSEMTNWICFGTTENCGTDETDSDGNSIPDGIDKYMYRIIGITEEGQMYLIKETFLKEDGLENPVIAFAWDSRQSILSSNNWYCNDGVCSDWNTSILFKRINGTSNGIRTGTGGNLQEGWSDIFVDSVEYNYLRSGDGENGGSSASKWYNLIADHEWMYGDTKETKYNGNEMYAIETGKAPTIHYVQNPEGSLTVVEEKYRWSAENKVKAKISLMYIHDYLYSYYDNSAEESRGNPKNYDTAKNGWLFFQKDTYNASLKYEWLSTRWGLESPSSRNFTARIVANIGSVGAYELTSHNGGYVGCGLRPVFYLSSKAKIVSGEGTKANPYILDVN